MRGLYLSHLYVYQPAHGACLDEVLHVMRIAHAYTQPGSL